MIRYVPLILLLMSVLTADAASYHVGPDAGQLASISAVPWATLNAGDTVYIHWRASPYKEKWVLCRQGTSTSPITISGVANPGGDLPIIDGENAITASGLNYWNEERGVIKIGGANTPADTMPQYIVIENLEVRSARPAYDFTNDNNNPSTYSSNAASIFIEKGQHITIRNCSIHNSGNGIFCAINNGNTQNITIEHCSIYDNGISSSYYEHNIYAAAVGITYQYNHLGPLRSGCLGNNLKDRSVGTVVRYNWIESGNRQLDLVDCEDDSSLVSNPDYRSTYVYGNIFVEPDSGNRQIIHYGGDSGDASIYRKGTLYLYNNSIISTRSGRSTLLRLTTNDESCDARNNIIYVTAAGSELSMLDSSGSLDLRNNWIKSGYVSCHSTLLGSVTDSGGNISGSDPGFSNYASQDYSLSSSSNCLDAGTTLSGVTLNKQYLVHQLVQSRPVAGALDLGAFERPSSSMRRRITIMLPEVIYEAEIEPVQTPTESGSTRIFSNLDTDDNHDLTFVKTGSG